MPREKRKRRGYEASCSDHSDDSDDRLRSEHVKYNNSDGEVDFTKYALKDFAVVFETCKSVIYRNLLIACSGTVVDHVGSETWILTSATLVRIPHTEHEAYDGDDIKIEVVLHNKQTVQGSLAMCDLHYNLAIVTIKSPIDLPAVELSDLPECYSMQLKRVVAVGRDTRSILLMRSGKLIRENSKLDCNELLVCTCDVNKSFIGGPIMDLENRIVGVTFFYKDTTPLLPVEIAARCLKSFRKHKKLLPWIRVRGQAVHMLDLPVLEDIWCKYSMTPSGILVNKVCEISPENCGGIEIGGVISELDGVYLSSVAQFTVMFLEKLEAAKDAQNAVTLEAVVQRPTGTTFLAKLDAREVSSEKCDRSFQNRWPLKLRKRWFM